MKSQIRKNCLSGVKILVGRYDGNQNETINKQWLNLEEYTNYDELMNHINEIHADVKDLKLVICDYEDTPFFQKLGLVSKEKISKNIFDVADLVNEFYYDMAVIEAYQKLRPNKKIEDILEYILDNYWGEYNSDEEFTKYFSRSMECYPSGEDTTIDWKEWTRKVMRNFSKVDKHYFMKTGEFHSIE